jgi:hypothetical protein
MHMKAGLLYSHQQQPWWSVRLKRSDRRQRNKISNESHQLRICVICRSYLNEVRRNYFKTVQTSQDGAQLARGPSAGLGCSSGRRKRGVNGINLGQGK